MTPAAWNRGHGARSLLLLLLCGVSTCATSATLVETRGDARDGDSGVLRYTEQHLLQQDGNTPRQRLVVYRCPDGRAFARKTVDYLATAAAAPAFALEDARLQYHEGARRDGDTLLTYAGFGNVEALKPAEVKQTAQLAIDAGFDAYVREHWAALQAGDKLSVDFLVPSRGRAYAFHLAKLREDTLDGAPASVFRLRLGGMLGWLVSDIDVSYRNSDQRLMRFAGLTNIRLDKKDLVAATIDFPIAAENTTPDPVLWQTLLDEPLTDCALGAP